MEKFLGDKGKTLADNDRAEHNTVKEELYKLQNAAISDITNCRQLFDTLMKDLSEHIKHEEENDLPALEKAMVGDQSKDMATSFERTKMFVPTRYVDHE